MSTTFRRITALLAINIACIVLIYLFNTITTIPIFNPSPADTAIADAMMASWATLARSGDPNAAELGASWQPYDAARDNYLDFGATVSTGEGLRTDKCDMWDGLMQP
jgi:carboxylesterase type B